MHFDNFIMCSFFMISGLFGIRGKNKKGSLGFIRDGFIRLMVPFSFVALFINLISQDSVFNYHYQITI